MSETFFTQFDGNFTPQHIHILKYLLKEGKVSIPEFSSIIGADHSTVYKWFNGTITYCHHYFQAKLSFFLCNKPETVLDWLKQRVQELRLQKALRKAVR